MFLRSLLFLITTVLVAGQVQAAEITRRQDLAPRLSELKLLYPRGQNSDASVYGGETAIFHVSGVIEKGDLEKLKSAIGDTWGKVIVFDSPGGSFTEGIRIGRYLQENAGSQDPDLYGVFVLKGERCLSACALAFTLAATPRNVVLGEDTRFVEVGALLGYHMAFLPEDQANQLVAVQTAMNLAYEVTQTYVSLIKGGLAPSNLLEEALSHRSPDSFFYLTGGIRTFAMGMSPVSSGPLAQPLNDSALKMNAVNAMCNQLFMAENSILKSEVEYEFGSIDMIAAEANDFSLEDMAGRAGSPRISASHNGAGYCTVEYNADGSVGIRMTSGRRACETGSYEREAWCAEQVDQTRFFKATNALLAVAAGCNEGRLTKKSVYWGLDVLTYGDTTVNASDVDWKRTVGRDVNVRQNPSLEAATVGSLRAGDEVQIAGCRVVPGPQGVWYQLSEDGWISARFVSRFDGWSRPALETP